MTGTHVFRALAVCLAAASLNAHAAQAQWQIDGSIGSLTSYSKNMSTNVVVTGPANQIGQLTVGQQFRMDVVMDLDANTVTSVSLKTNDGLRSYFIRPGEGVQPNFWSNTGGLSGTLTLTNDYSNSPADTLLAGFLLSFSVPSWTESASPYTLADLTQVLADGGYNSDVTFQSDLYSGPVGWAKTGTVRFNVNAVTVAGAVPEASTVATFGLGLLAMVPLVRARRRQSLQTQ